MQQTAIPLISLYGNIIAPIQFPPSDRLIQQLARDVLETISRGRHGGLVLDLSGVDVLDSHTTRCLRDLALAAKLMGVETVLCGLPPEVVLTLVQMDLAVPGLTSTLNLERALDHLRRRAIEDGEDTPLDGLVGSGADRDPLDEVPS